MAQAKLRVTYDDGRQVEVKISPRAQVATERHYELSFSEAGKVEHIFFLAWASLNPAVARLTDQSTVSQEFDKFLDEVAEVDGVEESADPTASGAEGTTPTASTTDSSG